MPTALNARIEPDVSKEDVQFVAMLLIISIVAVLISIAALVLGALAL